MRLEIYDVVCLFVSLDVFHFLDQAFHYLSRYLYTGENMKLNDAKKISASAEIGFFVSDLGR